MLAAQYTDVVTDWSSIKIRQVPKPVATKNLVLVKVIIAAINPIDHMVAQGLRRPAGWSLPLPFTPGYDFSGVVEAVGEEVTDFKAGDEVFAVNWGKHKHDDADYPVGGAFAQYIAVPAHLLSHKPAGLSHELAAAVALVGVTAHGALFTNAQVQRGHRILVLGGASAVGSIAVQLAKRAGAWVAVTSSSRTLDHVKTLGADKIINYTETKWEDDADLRDLDFVFDTVGEKDALSRSVDNHVLKSDGAFVTIVNGSVGYNPAGHPPLRFAAMTALWSDTKVQDELAALLVSGELKLNVEEEFPFTDEGVHAIFQKILGGKSVGKNILRISH